MDTAFCVEACQGQSKIRPPGRRKSLPVWLRANDLIKGPIGPFIRLCIFLVLFGFALIEAVAIAVHLKDVDVMGQPIK